MIIAFWLMILSQPLESKTKNYFSINTTSEKASVHCSPISKDNNKFTYIFVNTNEILYEFIFRRPWNNTTCQWRKAEIQKILKSNKKITIYADRALSSTEFPSEKDDLGLSPPKRKHGQKYKSWIFTKIASNNLCHSYFKHDCAKK